MLVIDGKCLIWPAMNSFYRVGQGVWKSMNNMQPRKGLSGLEWSQKGVKQSNELDFRIDLHEE